ncbi:hypothetical protein MHYP_G00220850 [Metynnis hypsauchen]
MAGKIEDLVPALLLSFVSKAFWGVLSESQSAYFLPEFALSPQGSFLEDTTGEQYLTYRYDDQNKMAPKIEGLRNSSVVDVLEWCRRWEISYQLRGLRGIQVIWPE